MGSYVQLGEVRTYHEEDGDGPPLVLLHPGGADSRAFEVIVPGLAGHFRVLRPDRRGHGRTPDVEGPITYELMAQDTVAFLEQVVGGPAYLVGHSDGAPVALLTALARPDLVPRLVFASGVFHHDGWAPGAIDLDEETTAFFVEYHGAVSPDGPDAFPALAAKLHRMHSEEPTLTVADLAGYPGPALVAVGLIVLGLAKLVAAAAMWESYEWGGYLLAATVALLLPFDLRQAVIDPTVGHVLLAVANAAALAVLVLLVRGWLPGRPPIARPNRR